MAIVRATGAVGGRMVGEIWESRSGLDEMGSWSFSQFKGSVQVDPVVILAAGLARRVDVSLVLPLRSGRVDYFPVLI